MWVYVEPNIRWHYEVLMWSSQSDVCKLILFTQHVSVVEQYEKLCFIVHLKQEQYYYQKYVVILYNGTFDIAFM